MVDSQVSSEDSTQSFLQLQVCHLCTVHEFRGEQGKEGWWGHDTRAGLGCWLQREHVMQASSQDFGSHPDYLCASGSSSSPFPFLALCTQHKLQRACSWRRPKLQPPPTFILALQRMTPPSSASRKCLLLVDKTHLSIFRKEMNKSTCISLSTLPIP